MTPFNGIRYQFSDTVIITIGPSFHSDLPWDITTDLLSRELSAINADAISDISELFSSLSIESKGVQRATYGIIHRAIPKIQETLSFDVALSKTAVHLPDQLLALLSQVPPIAPFKEADIDENFWLGARSYLLGWKVVFDHFAPSVRLRAVRTNPSDKIACSNLSSVNTCPRGLQL